MIQGKYYIKIIIPLTDHLQISLARAHWICVDLAQVPAAVRLLHLSYVQVPGTVVVVGEGDASILRNHFVVDGENGLSVHTNPR